MPGAIHFTNATDAAGVKAEFVKELRDEAKSVEHGMKALVKGAEKAKAVEQAKLALLLNLADRWDAMLIGDPSQPRQAQAVQAPTPAVAGGRAA